MRLQTRSGSHSQPKESQPKVGGKRWTAFIGLLLELVLVTSWLTPSVVLAQATDAPRPPPAGAPADKPAEAKAPATRQRVLILRTDIDKSGLSPNQGLQLTKDLFAQAGRYKQLDVVLSSLDLVEEMFEFECTEASAECLGKVGAKYAAQLVVYSTIDKVATERAGAPVLQMRVIDVVQLRVAQTTNQTLESVDKSSAAIQRGLVVLLGPVDMPTDAVEATGTVQVVLFGGGVALVYVDGKLAGRTSVGGLKVVVPVGSHTVRVVRAGFKDWSGKVQVTAGATVEQTVQLEQQAVVSGPGGVGTPAVTEVPITRKWWFWTGIGVAAIGVGVLAAVLAGGDDKPTTGGASLGIGSGNAWLDPVFGVTAP
jgi:hypothetical protein